LEDNAEPTYYVHKGGTDLAEFSPQTLRSWLNSKGFEFRCPVCGYEEYVPGEHPIQATHASSGFAPGPLFRGAYVYCTNCGYTMFFSEIPLEDLER
jgi:predicted nucleic-acid-binding Zn-ribbon protein